MINEVMLKTLNEKYQTVAFTFEKKDYLFLEGKDTARGRMLGFLTADYWKREQLWKTGTIVWGYVFKMILTPSNDPSRAYSSWVLFSPSKQFVETPELYFEILGRLNFLETEKPKNSKIRKLKTAMYEDLSEPEYLEIPEPYANGNLVYLSTVYVRPQHVFDLHLGYIPLMISPLVTKEVMYLPEKYWTDEFRSEYYK